MPQKKFKLGSLNSKKKVKGNRVESNSVEANKYEKKYHDGFSDDEDNEDRDRYMECGGGRDLDNNSNGSSDDMEDLKR